MSAATVDTTDSVAPQRIPETTSGRGLNSLDA